MKNLLADDHGTTYTGTAWPKRITRNKKLEHLRACAARERWIANFMLESNRCSEDISYFSRRASMFSQRVSQMEAG